jgi:hypothetical protein
MTVRLRCSVPVRVASLDRDRAGKYNTTRVLYRPEDNFGDGKGTVDSFDYSELIALISGWIPRRPAPVLQYKVLYC